MEHLKAKIRQVPDFPKPGILYYDITTLLRDPIGLREAIDGLTEPFRDQQIDLVVGIESRGFILGAAVADLEAVGVSVMHHTSSGLGHGLDDGGVSKGMEFLAGIFGVDLEAMAQQSGPA